MILLAGNDSEVQQRIDKGLFENFSTVALYVETKSVSETLLTFICLKTLFSCFAPNKP